MAGTFGAAVVAGDVLVAVVALALAWMALVAR